MSGHSWRGAMASTIALLLIGTSTPVSSQSPMPGTGEAPGQSFPIDLPTAMRLARNQNLDVQIARANLEEAKATHGAAIAKFLPWVTVGVAFRRHEGSTQAVNGTLLDVDKQSTALGPTVTAQVDLGEAVFTTLAARQAVNASISALTVQGDDSAVGAASGYMDLLKAQSLVEINAEALRTSEEYQRQLNGAVSAGIAFKGDLLRVETQTERYRAALLTSQQQQVVASARLAQLLRLDASVQLTPQDSDLVPIALIDTESQLDAHLVAALEANPRIKQSQAQVEVAREARKGAVYGPLIPSIGAQAFLGELGGGSGNASGNFSSSRDYYFGISWRFGPGGLFDFSRIHGSKARLNAAQLGAEKVADNVRRQVVESYSRVKSLGAQLRASRSSVAAATETLRLTRERKQLGVGAVLEDIQAQQELARARAEYASTIAEYNKSQYELAGLQGDL